MPVRAVVGGQLAGAQRWSMGFSLGIGSFGSPPSVEAINALAEQLYQDFLTAAWNTAASGAQPLKAAIGSGGTVDGLAAYEHAGGGPSRAIGRSTGASQAGTGSQIHPPQTAIVATLLSADPSRRGRGRVYVPNMALSTASLTLGTFSSAIASGISVTVANLLSLWATRSLDTQEMTPVVESTTGGFTTNPILSVRVDNVFDTQRRRRDKIVPTARPQTSLIVG